MINDEAIKSVSSEVSEGVSRVPPSLVSAQLVTNSRSDSGRRRFVLAFVFQWANVGRGDDEPMRRGGAGARWGLLRVMAASGSLRMGIDSLPKPLVLQELFGFGGLCRGSANAKIRNKCSSGLGFCEWPLCRQEGGGRDA